MTLPTTGKTGTGLSVLVVDDEELQRRAVAALVERAGRGRYRVLQAGDGKAAVELAAADRPEVVLMDLKMPGLDGLEAARRIRLLDPPPRVIFLTAYDEFEYAREAVKIGALDYLLKPADPKELERLLRAAEDEARDAAERSRREQEFRRRLSRAMPLLRQELLHDLLAGGLDPGEAAERARLVGSGPLGHTVLCVGPTGAGWPAGNGPAHRAFLLRQAVEAAAAAAGAPRRALAGPVAGVIMVVASPGGREEALKLAQGLRAAVGRRTGCAVVAGISRPVEDTAGLPAAGAEALRAYQHAARSATAQVVVDLADLEGRAGPANPPSGLETRLAEAVRLGERQEAADAAERLADEIVARTAGHAAATGLALLETVVILSRAAADGGAEAAELQARSLDYVRRLNGLTRPDEARALLGEAARSYCEAAILAQERRRRGLAEKALAYMRANYAREISLEEVARALHISPYYLSHLFRERVGGTFTERLTELRLGEAKRLLAGTDLLVAEVAERVGYRDANYFCRVFRKREGQTPRAYRSRGLLREGGREA